MVSYKSGIREGLRKIEWRSSKIMTLARLGKCTEICEVYRAGRNWKRCDLGAMASIAGRDPPGWLVCEQVHSHVRIGSRKWKQADNPDETPGNVRIEMGSPVIAPRIGTIYA